MHLKHIQAFTLKITTIYFINYIYIYFLFNIKNIYNYCFYLTTIKALN